MLRTCPYCQSSFSPLAFARAGFWKEKALHCPTCHKTISEFGLYPPFLPYLTAAVIMVGTMQAITVGWLIGLFLIPIGGLIILMILSYLMTPLKRVELERSLLNKELQYYRNKPYTELVALVGQEDKKQVTNKSGIPYFVFIKTFLVKKNGGIRVRAWISNIEQLDLDPIMEEFMMTPDGMVIDE